MRRGLNSCPDGLGQHFWEEFAWFWGGLDPCPDGLGNFFRRWSAPECPFECGAGGAKAIRAMPKCPQHEFQGGFPYLVKMGPKNPGTYRPPPERKRYFLQLMASLILNSCVKEFSIPYYSTWIFWSLSFIHAFYAFSLLFRDWFSLVNVDPLQQNISPWYAWHDWTSEQTCQRSILIRYLGQFQITQCCILSMSSQSHEYWEGAREALLLNLNTSAQISV